jgi:CRP-like cAMP-binding protein
MCHVSSSASFAGGDVVLSPRNGFRGLFVVTDGTFAVRPSAEAKGAVGHEFGVGDLFGEEALVAKKRASSVAIICKSYSGSCVVVHGEETLRHVLFILRGVFKLTARQYSLHDDL